MPALQKLTRHCEKRSDEAIQNTLATPGLLRFARNDGHSQRVIKNGVALGVDGSNMAVEGTDFPENRCIVGAWRFRLAGEPAENIAIGGFKQSLIVAKLALGEVGDLSVGKTAKDEVHLAHSAMPGTKKNAPLPYAKSRDLWLRARHDLCSSQNGNTSNNGQTDMDLELDKCQT
jgi:hypothetical protein